MCCSVSSGDGNTSLSNRHIVGSASSSSQSAQDLVIDIYTWAYQFIHEKCIIHLLVTLIIIAIIVVMLKWFPILARFQVIDHIEAIILSVSWSNLEVLLFTHVLTQNRCICEYLLAVQALKSVNRILVSHSDLNTVRNDLLWKLAFQHVQEFIHVDQVVRKTNVEVVLGKHVLEKNGSILDVWDMYALFVKHSILTCCHK